MTRTRIVCRLLIKTIAVAVLSLPIAILASYVAEQSAKGGKPSPFPITQLSGIVFYDDAIWVGAPTRGSILKVDTSGQVLESISLPFDGDMCLWLDDGIYIYSRRTRQAYQIINNQLSEIASTPERFSSSNACDHWSGDIGDLHIEEKLGSTQIIGVVNGKRVSIDYGLYSQFLRLTLASRITFVVGYVIAAIGLFMFSNKALPPRTSTDREPGASPDDRKADVA